nr:MBOAT family O-acyltransferase [uncultured Blautia sp.]
MNFISLTFVFLFPAVLFIYWKLPWKYRELFLLVVSYFFYIKESSRAGELLLLTTIITYLAGIAIEKGRHKKGWLIFTVAVCMGFLIGLKYSVPPVGISFYTFQTMAYVIDVYRGEVSAEKNPRSYALFVSFFPQLVAGPIERAGNLLSQLKEKHMKSREDLINGGWLMLRGFYKKVVVADYLAAYVDKVYASPEKAGGIGAVLGTAFFAIQIYCDFSGYTDIARGAARMMGIHLMENFRHPYRAVSIQDFWRRWHISLTRWFTDYVYIPLGGNRKGLVKQCRNILIIFLLSGFWHGASWNFVVWGMIHGIYMVAALVITRIRNGKSKNLHPVAGWVMTVLLVNVAWVFFRAPSLTGAWQILKQPFVNPLGGGFPETMSFLGIQGTAALRLLFIGISWIVLEQFPEEVYKRCQAKRGLCLMAAVFVVMVTVIEFSWLGMMASGGENSFIYFRF